MTGFLRNAAGSNTGQPEMGRAPAMSSGARKTTPQPLPAAGSDLRIENLQILRLLAALLVIWFHWSGSVSRTGGALSAFEPGIFGVDIFFVLSGFIMALITRGRRLSPARFFLNRLGRIAPLYWLLTLALFATALAAPGLLESTEADIGHLVSSLLFLPFSRETGLSQPLLFLGWTLNYEMFFYVLVALSLRFRRPAVFLTLILAALVLSGQLFRPGPGALQFYTDPIMLEFLAGFLLFRLWQLPHATGGTGKRGTGGFRPGVKPAAGLMCIVGGGLLFVALQHYLQPYNPHRTVVFLAPAVLFVFGAACLPPLRFTGRRAWVALGDASYAMYLIHPYIQKLLLLALPGTVGLVGSSLLMLVMVAGAGLLLFRCIETPARQALRGWHRGKPGSAWA